MYAVDHRDVVVAAKAPQSSIGAPCPIFLAAEHHLHLAYYLEEPVPGWDGSFARAVDHYTDDKRCALIRFTGPYAHIFGPPNDDRFECHPLASRGLHPYGAFEVKHSSWMRGLERTWALNSPSTSYEDRQWQTKFFAARKHVVFAFHDSTFECVCRDLEISIVRGSVSSVLLASWPG
jgi:hypothetical protein